MFAVNLCPVNNGLPQPTDCQLPMVISLPESGVCPYTGSVTQDVRTSQGYCWAYSQILTGEQCLNVAVLVLLHFKCKWGLYCCYCTKGNLCRVLFLLSLQFLLNHKIYYPGSMFDIYVSCPSKCIISISTASIIDTTNQLFTNRQN